MTPTTALENTVIDIEGRHWLDMHSGVLNVSLGHGSEIVYAALADVQNTGLINTYSNWSTNAMQLQEMLLPDLIPGYRWRLLSTGAECIDRAIQIVALRANRAPRIAVVKGGFHGKMLYMSAMRNVVPWGSPVRLLQIDPRDLFDDNAVPEFDALIYEPIMNQIGLNLISDQWRLREICERQGALLIADEMITGMFRCGEPKVSEDADMVIIGKGLGQGVPLAALGYKRVLSDKLPDDWTTTTAGNNLCATVGLHVVREFKKRELHYHIEAHQIGRRLNAIGFNSVGAYGWKKFKDIEGAEEALMYHRILATSRRNLIRVAPSFATKPEHFDRLEEALEGIE